MQSCLQPHSAAPVAPWRALLGRNAATTFGDTALDIAVSTPAYLSTVPSSDPHSRAHPSSVTHCLLLLLALCHVRWGQLSRGDWDTVFCLLQADCHAASQAGA